MGTITLTSVTLSGTPIFNQVVNIKIRVTSDPDVAASYTDKGNFTVLPNGNFSSPVVISGLADSTSYTVWVTSACSDSSFTHNFITLARVNYNVIEQSSPSWADANLQIKVNGIAVLTINFTQSGTIYVPVGSTVTFEAFGEFPSSGDTPQLHLNAKKNTVTFFDETDPDVPGVSIVTPGFTVTQLSVYDVLVESTASAPATPVACGASTSYTGGATFPTDTIIDLGTGTGSVVLTYDMFSVPDKAQVLIDGIIKLDTGYRGDSSEQSALNAALATHGLPPETIQGPGAGSGSFNKVTASRYAVVRIWAPIGGTAWTFNLACPV